MIVYQNNVHNITPELLDGFFVDWPNKPSSEKHLQMLRSSFKVQLALEDGRVVGFVNAISDGVYYGYIPLLEVLPEYQGRGIGRELVTRILEELNDLYAIDICCDENVVGFYKKLGFYHVHGMIKRNFSNQ